MMTKKAFYEVLFIAFCILVRNVLKYGLIAVGVVALLALFIYGPPVAALLEIGWP